MRTLSSRLIAPLAASAIFSLALLAGCADAPSSSGAHTIGTTILPTAVLTAPPGAPMERSTASDVEVLRDVRASPLSPEQGGPS